MKTFFLILVLISTFTFTFSNSTIDSLLIQSKKIQNSNPDSAKFLVEKALLESKYVKDSNNIAESYKQLGVVYYFLSDLVLSKKYILKSLEIFQELRNDSKAATCINNLGAIHYESGELEKALYFYSESIKILREDTSAKTMYAMVLNNIGNVYKDLEKFDYALEYYNKSMKIKQSLEDQLGVAIILSNIGWVYKDMVNYDSSIAFLNRSKKINIEIDNQYGLAVNFNNLGEIYYQQRLNDMARKEFDKSLKINYKIGNKSMIASNLINIAKIDYAQKKFDSAIKRTNEGIAISKETEIIKYQKEGYFILYEIYKSKNNYKNALKYFIKFEEYNQKIINEENIRQLSILEAELENSETKKEIENLKKEKKIGKLVQERINEANSNQKMVIICLTAALVVTLIILIILMIRIKKNKSTLKKLVLKSEIAINSINPVIIYDSSLNIEWMNNAAEDMFATNLKKAKGLKLAEFIKIDKTDNEFNNLIITLTNGNKFTNKLICRARGDDQKLTKNLHFCTSPLYDNDVIVNFTEIITDISRVKN